MLPIQDERMTWLPATEQLLLDQLLWNTDISVVSERNRNHNSAFRGRLTTSVRATDVKHITRTRCVPLLYRTLGKDS